MCGFFIIIDSKNCHKLFVFIVPKNKIFETIRKIMSLINFFHIIYEVCFTDYFIVLEQ